MGQEAKIDISGMQIAIKEYRIATLTQAVCETVAYNEPEHAARLVLVSLVGALMKAGEMDLAEKIADFVATI